MRALMYMYMYACLDAGTTGAVCAVGASVAGAGGATAAGGTACGAGAAGAAGAGGRGCGVPDPWRWSTWTS